MHSHVERGNEGQVPVGRNSDSVLRRMGFETEDGCESQTEVCKGIFEELDQVLH